MLEVFDELGIKPTIIAGTSIGALYGAAYASGLSAKQIRAYTEEILGRRLDLIRQLFASRSEPVQRLLRVVPVRSSLLNSATLLDLLYPDQVAKDFSVAFHPPKGRCHRSRFSGSGGVGQRSSAASGGCKHRHSLYFSPR